MCAHRRSCRCWGWHGPSASTGSPPVVTMAAWRRGTAETVRQYGPPRFARPDLLGTRMCRIPSSGRRARHVNVPTDAHVLVQPPETEQRRASPPASGRPEVRHAAPLEVMRLAMSGDSPVGSDPARFTVDPVSLRKQRRMPFPQLQLVIPWLYQTRVAGRWLLRCGMRTLHLLQHELCQSRLEDRGCRVNIQATTCMPSCKTHACREISSYCDTFEWRQVDKEAAHIEGPFVDAILGYHGVRAQISRALTPA